MNDPLPDWKTMERGKRDAYLLELAKRGYSCTVIASHFRNCSRSAVIGMLSRIEARDGKVQRNRSFDRNVTPAPDGMKVVARPKAKTSPRADSEVEKKQHIRPFNIQVRAENTPPSRILPSEQRGVFDPLPDVKPIPIIDLPNRLRCRWPVDVEQSDLKFACGAPTCSDIHVYCATHRSISMVNRRQPQEHVDGESA